MRTPESLVPHGGAVVIPKESAQLDYEGEIVLVVGQGGRRIPEGEAMAHVFGYTLMNEGSVRDWLRHAKFNVTQGKNFDRSGAIGPYVVPGDLIATGTPTGAGARFDPPRYLEHGDTVRVVAEGIGELLCRVERER
jgi:2-keto-4-pentenoate hydratase/2-oxohepta-3-ene-1,7-dioic acid hydratase in catechol pathway